MDKIDIYVATLVSFDRIGETKYNDDGTQVLSKILEFTNIRTMDCVIDEERGNAIDIETGNIYHIIKRDNRGILLPDEAEFINKTESGVLFVYKYREKNMKDISLLYQMNLKARAQKKYEQYLENLKKDEPQKSLKKGTKQNKKRSN